MEEHNELSKQINSVENTDVDQLQKENANLKQALDNVYNRMKQLENTWLLNRAGFLFEVLKSEYFDNETKDKASTELTKFLFPEETNKNQ